MLRLSVLSSCLAEHTVTRKPAVMQVEGECQDEEAPAQPGHAEGAAAVGPQAQDGSRPEGEPDGAQAGVGPGSVVLARLHRLRKVYGSHVAVHDLSLHLCMDEVTALLGHNGAGVHSSAHTDLLCGFY